MPVSTTSFVAAKEVVDTGMRQHDGRAAEVNPSNTP
jgi:hypothetical protein